MSYRVYLAGGKFLAEVDAPSSFEARRRVAAGHSAMRASDCYAIRADLDRAR